MRSIPATKPPMWAHQAVPPLPVDSAMEPTPLKRLVTNQKPIMKGAGMTAGMKKMMGMRTWIMARGNNRM